MRLLSIRSFNLTALLFFLLFLGKTTAQPPVFESLTANEGLSQGMIFDIMQDHRGFLWFATKDGLNRYDGYQFRVWQNDPFNPFSISDNDVQSLLEDRLGRIWIATTNNGINVFNPASNRFYSLRKLRHKTVSCLAETADGAIWLGTSDGLNRVKLPDLLPPDQPDLNEIAKVESFISEKDKKESDERVIIALHASRDGRLWVATWTQIGFFEPQKPSFQPVFRNGTLNAAGQNFSTNFVETPDGLLLAGQNTRLVAIDRSLQTHVFPFPVSGFTGGANIALATDGTLFLGNRKRLFSVSADQFSANRLAEKKTFRPFHEFPESGIIGATELFFDRSGLLWIGTNGYGLRKFNPGNPLFQHFLPGLSLRRIIDDQQGHVWFWQQKMFNRLDKATGLTTEWPFHLPETNEHDLLFSKNGRGWLLCEDWRIPQNNGLLIRIDPQTLRPEARFPVPITVGMFSQIKEDHAGNLWISGVQSQIARFDPVREISQIFDFSAATGFKEAAYSLRESPDGILWIGTPHGLVRATPTADQPDFFVFKNNPADPQSLANNFILATLDDPAQPENFIWVATKGGGLHKMDKKTGQTRRFTTADGLPNNVIYSILSDKNGRLWLSTNSGLSKFDPQSGLFQNFSVADGLQDNEFNSVSFEKSSDGQLLFGGVNGLTAFFSEKLEAANTAPPVLITALKIQNRLALPGDGILQKSIENTTAVELLHSQNQLTFEFAAMDFATPKKNQYRYRLTGVDGDWVEATTANSANYANLSPGKYVFEVVTGGSHGAWNGPAARLEIRILPPFWRTWWAYLVYFLAILWAGWAFYRFQNNRLRLKSELAFGKREADRLLELDRLKTNFFSSVTHEFRTPLTLLLEPARQLLVENTAPSPTRFRLELMEKTARRLLKFVNQMLDLSKLEAGQMPLNLRIVSLVEVVREVVEAFAEAARQKGISFKISLPDHIPPVEMDNEKLEHILSNLLSNALKFTPKGGEIDCGMRVTDCGLNAESDTDQTVIRNPYSAIDFWVSDTGPGIVEADLPRIFDRFFQAEHAHGGTGIGLALTKELVERMGGEIQAENEPGRGARFWVKIPVFSPVSPAEMSKKQSHSTPAAAENGLSPVISPLTSPLSPLILLIEDDADLRQFLRASMPPVYRIAEAANGADGIEMALEWLPDLILTDLMMPEKNGFEVIDALKNDPRTSHIPIILLTAKAAAETRIEGLRRGADLYLNKPFRADELLASMENLLNSRRHLQENFSKSVETASVSASATAVFDPHENEFLRQLMDIIEQHMDDERLDAEGFARAMFMSRSQLHRKLVALTSLSLTEFVRNFRLDRAREMLLRREGNVSEIAGRTGFGNAKYFATSFLKRFGHSPSEAMNGHF